MLRFGFDRAYLDRFRGKGDYYDSGDAGVIDEQGYVSVLSRADDLIKYVRFYFQENGGKWY